LSEPLLTSVGDKSKKITLLITSIVGIIMIGAIIWGVVTFLNYRSNGGIPPLTSARGQVAIISPQTGAQIEAGDTLTVDVSAIGPTAYNSVELWLNGELAGVQAAVSGGMQPFSTQFSWYPTDPGYHALMAVGVDTNGLKTLSTQVVVLILEGEEEKTDLDASLSAPPVVEPAPPGGASSPPGGPGEGEPVNPAGIWAGTLGDITTSLTVDAKPSAPELTAEPGECAASLLIHDLSNYEEGFVVYRQIINTPDWQKIATLSSQSQGEWLEYVDEGIYGAVTYYVSAFNSQGEAQSNPVLVNIDPASCPDKGDPMLVESVDVALQLSEIQADKVYCYLSQNGENWSRWPLIGFLYPDEEGILPSGPLSAQRVNGSGANGSAMPFMMECWGWQGGSLLKIGTSTAAGLQPDLSGKQMVFGEGFDVELSFATEPVFDMSDLYPVGDEGLAALDLQMDPSLGSKLPLLPVDPDVPRVNLSVTTDREECGEHVPPEAQNFLGQMLFCFPYPQYDVDKGATVPQPYLVWGFDPVPTCAAGPAEECKSYSELLSNAEETGGEVGFELVSVRNGKSTKWSITDPYLTMFVVPPGVCIGDRQFSVRLWYRPGTKGVSIGTAPEFEIYDVDEFKIPAGLNTYLYGPFSNIVTVPCHFEILPSPSVVEKVAYVDVSFMYLEIFNQDDGIYANGSDDFHLEVYGYFRATSPSMGIEMEKPCFSIICDPETYTAYKSRYALVDKWGGVGHFTIAMVNPATSFPIPLFSRELCKSTTRYYCNYEGTYTSFDYQNHTVRAKVKDGDALTFEVNLMDSDELTDHDQVCYIYYTSPEKTIAEWSQVDWVEGTGMIQTEEFVLTGSADDGGSCQVTIELKPVPYP
jgi:hypothetical protein